MNRSNKIDILVLAQKCVALIETTKMVATYKPATFMALLNVITQRVDKNGRPPKQVKVADVGREVLRLYWNQAVGFSGGAPLKQSAQRDVVAQIVQYRATHKLALPRNTIEQARSQDPKGFRSLELRCIRTVANYPVRLLQKFGEGNNAREEHFLYGFSWNGGLSARQVETSHLILKPGVGEGLLLLSPLLRVQLENQWMTYVSERNRLPRSGLNKYLFGFMRTEVASLAKHLVPLQNSKCFYCGGAITKANAHVDHVVPWSFSHDDGLDNLVAACAACNLNKSAMLLGLAHLKNWGKRLIVGSPENLRIVNLASKNKIHRDLDLTHRLARSAYSLAPQGTSVWNSRGSVATLNRQGSLKILNLQ